MTGPQAAWLEDGRRLHLNHGPIDLIVEAFGPEGETKRAYAQAVDRFRTVLDELVGELPELRRPCGPAPRLFEGAVARRMEAAACRHVPVFVTPMAAVAGAVAETVLAAMTDGTGLARAYVNNGGDVALHLAPGETIGIAVAAPRRGMADRVTIGYDDPVRGIATSGWAGRSHSLGIADAVTVLAAGAADADVAATLIANAVDLVDHPAIRREPASALSPDSDLGGRAVTVAVGELSSGDRAAALDAGRKAAEGMAAGGLIAAAALFLQGDRVLVGAGLDRLA